MQIHVAHVPVHRGGNGAREGRARGGGLGKPSAAGDVVIAPQPQNPTPRDGNRRRGGRSDDDRRLQPRDGVAAPSSAPRSLSKSGPAGGARNADGARNRDRGGGVRRGALGNSGGGQGRSGGGAESSGGGGGANRKRKGGVDREGANSGGAKRSAFGGGGGNAPKRASELLAGAKNPALKITFANAVNFSCSIHKATRSLQCSMCTFRVSQCAA